MSDWIIIGEIASSIRNKLNNLKLVVDGYSTSKADATTLNMLSDTVSSKAVLSSGKIVYTQFPTYTKTDSFDAWCSNINSTSLDAAFGKNNVAYMNGLGAQLAMYGWYKGLSTSQAELLAMCAYDTFTQICQNATLKNYIINTSVLYTLVTASPYATTILNS